MRLSNLHPASSSISQTPILQQGSFCLQVSLEPQSHCSVPSTIPLPQTWLNGSERERERERERSYDHWSFFEFNNLRITKQSPLLTIVRPITSRLQLENFLLFGKLPSVAVGYII